MISHVVVERPARRSSTLAMRCETAASLVSIVASASALMVATASGALARSPASESEEAMVTKRGADAGTPSASAHKVCKLSPLLARLGLQVGGESRHGRALPDLAGRQAEQCRGSLPRLRPGEFVGQRVLAQLDSVVDAFERGLNRRAVADKGPVSLCGEGEDNEVLELRLQPHQARQVDPFSETADRVGAATGASLFSREMVRPNRFQLQMGLAHHP